MSKADELTPVTPPDGTVTFLFTDIEGSTHLLRQHGAIYPAVLHWHREILRAAAAMHRGFEVDTQGDAMFFAFSRTRDALAAAAYAQTRFSQEDHEGVVLRVRMGLHTGEPIYSGGFYVGLDVHRGARLSAIAHGGQTVLSRVTRELVWGQLVSGLELRDVGVHELKDFAEPVRVFQLHIEGVPTDSRPLRSFKPVRHNIQHPTRPLIGRTEELKTALTLLDDSYTSILSLVGQSGAGKTRLAQEVACEKANDLELPGEVMFPDGVFWVALSRVQHAEEAIAAICEVVGLNTPTSRTLANLTKLLQPLRLLLVLDNCEQIANIASLVQEISQNAPHVKILLTSRVPLHLSRERELPLMPLSVPTWPLPPLYAATFEANEWRRYTAIAFFERCAVDSKPSWQLSLQTLPATVQICTLLDGLPLAIELAAARLKMLSLPILLQRLQSSLSLEVLSNGGYDRTPRQQTMRGAISWSYDLLSPRQRRVLCALSLFQGSSSLEAIEAIFQRVDHEHPPEEPLTSVFDELCSLVEQSLLLRAQPSDDCKDHEGEVGCEPRFRLPYVVQRFAAERLDEWPEAETLRHAFALYFVAFGERWDAGQAQSPQESTDAVSGEYASIAAALEWLIGQQSTQALQLGISLCWFWETRGLLTQGLSFLEQALEATSDSKDNIDALQSEAMNSAGTLCLAQGDVGAASRWFKRALDVRRQSGTPLQVAATLNNLSVAARRQGDYQTSRAGLEETLLLLEETGREVLMARVQNNLGNLLREIGEREAAQTLFGKSLSTLSRMNDEIGVAATLNNQGIAAREQGEYGVARGLLEGALKLQRRHCQLGGCAQTLHEMGLLSLELGEISEARLLFSEALWTWREAGDSTNQVLGMEGLARLSFANGDIKSALYFATIADCAREATALPRPPVEAQNWREFLERCEQSLSDDVVTQARVAGRIADLNSAVDEVLGARDQSTRLFIGRSE